MPTRETAKERTRAICRKLARSAKDNSDSRAWKMMAGTGVSGGGAGMLRTRRRDVSVKPNRKLDRKSSRGMIYENEELRLRTIHINAEVEQGQNDIKKLRRENEQLRREIWSLRDEYDKLEEILKRQKHQEESEEHEDRSEEDDGQHSDYSYEEDEEIEEEENEDEVRNGNQDERLENAENQKISSEKMNNSALHRLHVDFDDLSVVDEEEELKKDKEKREAISEENQTAKESATSPRQLHENIPFYPAAYEPPPNTFGASPYYAECPFEFPTRLDSMLPADTSAVLPSPCPGIYDDALFPLASLATPNPMAAQVLPQIQIPLGWQSNVVFPEKQLPGYTTLGTAPGIPLLETDPRFSEDRRKGEFQTGVSTEASTLTGTSSLLQRRNVLLRQVNRMKSPSMDVVQGSNSREMTFNRNDWNLAVNKVGAGVVNGKEEDCSKRSDEEPASTGSNAERPKHFFAPLPSKVKRPEDESPTASTIHFGTGTSSSSEKTGSTVISRGNRCAGQKGSADIYVNGAIPFGEMDRREADAQKFQPFLSFDALPVEDSKIGGSNQLLKSMSCQDLTSEQSLPISEQFKASQNGKPQMLTKSDNTLDNLGNGTSDKPYRTHLNVTLKVPRFAKSPSPETPEIPKLPSIDYRLFKNPFLRKYEQTYPNYPEKVSPVTSPLSIQVTDNPDYHYADMASRMASFKRGVDEKYHPVATKQPDHSRLLIPFDQLIDGKVPTAENKRGIQVTSFERPSPHNLLPSAIPYDLNTLRRITTNRYLQTQNLYQNVPFVHRGPAQHCPPGGSMRMYYDNVTTKVPAQTQTSIDGDSYHEEDQPHRPEDESVSVPNSPGGHRRKRTIKKDKVPVITKDQKPLSPAAQRRLRKQSSVTSSEAPDSPGKSAKLRTRKLSVTTTTTSEVPEDKNESRSSSSGQDSPRKDQTRRVSIYFNAKKRPSLASIKTTRSGSVDTSKDKYLDGPTTTTSERERTNSVSSRETSVKARKTSTSSGSVPWCACWGNGCI